MVKKLEISGFKSKEGDEIFTLFSDYGKLMGVVLMRNEDKGFVRFREEKVIYRILREKARIEEENGISKPSQVFLLTLEEIVGIVSS